MKLRSVLLALVPFILTLALVSCRSSDSNQEKNTAPLFKDLGNHHHTVTTNSEQAQRYFDQGLTLLYGFNHAEAVRSFREAARLDSTCAMAYWGVAYALGPNINMPMSDAAVPEAYAAAQKALQLAPHARETEQAYIQALAKRYSPEPLADRKPLDQAYADDMREVSQRYPGDLDAAALYAEALLDLSPWDYWTKDGQPKYRITEIISVLESVLARDPNHIGANHFYIHAVEASQNPQKAEAAADRLLNLVPGAGHLVHMPAHIYLRVGRYNDASRANELAAQADESYITQCRVQGFYAAAYYPHNIHFLWAAASMEGRSAVAINAARRLVANAPLELLRQYPFLEEILPTPYFALARFGKWDDLLREPQPPGGFLYTKGMWHYARGVAFAASGKIDSAQVEQAQFQEIAQNDSLKAASFWSGASAGSLLNIASHMLAAELAEARGQKEEEITQLKKAVEIQDQLPYMEPPPWYFPIRQALGAALLDAGRAEEAAAVYKRDLKENPRNGWSLFGLEQSLRAQGKTAEADEVQKRFQEAWGLADVTLRASIF